jgi:hypothetical protein
MPQSISKSLLVGFFQNVLLLSFIILISLLTSTAFASDTKSDDEEQSVSFAVSDRGETKETSITSDGTQNDEADKAATHSEGTTGLVKSDSQVVKSPVVSPVVSPFINSTPTHEAYDISNPDEKSILELMNSFFESTIGIAIVPSAMPSIIKEGARKPIKKNMRQLGFPSVNGEKDDTFALVDPSNHVRQSFAEATRLPPRLIAELKKSKNFTKVGEFIRSLYLEKGLMAIPAGFVAYITPGALSYAEIPADVRQKLDDYLKAGNLPVFGASSLILDLGSKASEDLIRLEHPNFEWVPAILSSSLTAAAFYLKCLGKEVSFPNCYAKSEMIGNAASFGLIVLFVHLDPKYAKYEIFDFSKSNNADILNNLNTAWNYNSAGFWTSVASSPTEFSTILIDSLVGGKDALIARGIIEPIKNWVAPFTSGNAQASGRWVAHALADNKPDREISMKVLQDYVRNLAASVPLLLVFRKIPNPAMGYIVQGAVVDLASFNVRNMATEHLKAFKTDENGWLSYIPFLNTALGYGGFAFFWTYPNHRNFNNLLILSYARAALNIIPLAAVFYNVYARGVR